MMTDIQFTFEQFLKTRCFKTVAEYLNAEGFRTENELMFTVQSVAIVTFASIIETCKLNKI